MLKFWVFLKKGFITATSYRMAFVLAVFSLLLSVSQMGFLATFLSEGGELPSLAMFSGNLLAYLISGTIFMSFVSLSLSSFQQAITSEQQMGTLPYLLVSPTPILLSLTLNSAWTFIWTALTSVVVLVATVWLFGAAISANIGACLIVMLVTILCLAGIGMASAGIVIVTKQGDPVSWALTTLAGFTSGVIFPVDVLPTWLQGIGKLLPTTYALSALRKVLLIDGSLHEVLPELTVLLLMSLFTVPLGVLIFKWGYKRARVHGSLADY